VTLRIQKTPGRNGEIGRGLLVSDAIGIVAWLNLRRSEFTAKDLSTELEWNLRRVYRWLRICEGRGIVEQIRHGKWKARAAS